MNIPCKRCITLAACKNKEIIDCSLLSHHYMSFLKINDIGKYKHNKEILNDRHEWWFHIDGIYSADREGIKYSHMIKNIFPILELFLITKESIDQTGVMYENPL